MHRAYIFYLALVVQTEILNNTANLPFTTQIMAQLLIITTELVSCYVNIKMHLEAVHHTCLGKNLSEQNEMLDTMNALKNEFFANTSHEMKTPLTVISAAVQFADALLEADGGNPEATHAASGIKSLFSIEVVSLLMPDVFVTGVGDTYVTLSCAPPSSTVEASTDGAQTWNPADIAALNPDTDYLLRITPADANYAPAIVGIKTLATSAVTGMYSVTYSTEGATAGIAPADPNTYMAGEAVPLLDIPDASSRLAKSSSALISFSTQPNGVGTRLLYNEPNADATISNASLTLYPIGETEGGGNEPGDPKPVNPHPSVPVSVVPQPVSPKPAVTAVVVQSGSSTAYQGV